MIVEVVSAALTLAVMQPAIAASAALVMGYVAPNLWAVGVLVHLGLGWVYASYLVMRLLVTISVHSDVCWDKPLYEKKWLSGIMWVVERLIVTPSAHHAHHGKHLADGVTHYKGNYGNTLILWDVLFGTARLTRRYPDAYGVENLSPVSAGEQLFWPLVRGSGPIVAVTSASPSGSLSVSGAGEIT